MAAPHEYPYCKPLRMEAQWRAGRGAEAPATNPGAEPAAAGGTPAGAWDGATGTLTVTPPAAPCGSGGKASTGSSLLGQWWHLLSSAAPHVHRGLQPTLFGWERTGSRL